MKIWVFRDKRNKGNSAKYVFLCCHNPIPDESWKRPWVSFLAVDFKRKFGYTPRMGTCEEKSLELLEPK